ncbi:MAG: EamA family transporter [Candidatus Methanomethylophilaceae archaeon]|nr:EamA family transporter [Candidatus Methanomethylophilaceae archaeon]
MNRKTVPMLMIVTAAVLWGFIGVFVRILSDAGLGTMQINGVRSLVCTCLIAMILLIYDRNLFKIDIRDIWLFVFAALMKLLMDICYVQAQLDLSLSLAAVLLSTDCYFMLIVSFFLFKGDVTWMKIFAAAMGFFGCAILVGLFTEDIGDINAVGVSIGLGSAVAGTFYAVGLKFTMMKGYDPTTVLFYVFLLGTFMIIPIMNLPGTVTIVMDDLGLLGFIVIIGIFFTLTPYYLYSRGLKDLQPSTVTILLFVETASAALAGLMFYNEQLTLLDIFGLGLILISLFLVDRDVDNKDE